MSWWLLLIEVFVVWLLAGIAGAGCHAVAQAQRGVPRGQRGVSLAPIIPVVPLVFWGLALLVDLVAGPWGTVVVGWLHAVLGVYCVGCIGLTLRRLRTLDKHA